MNLPRKRSRSTENLILTLSLALMTGILTVLIAETLVMAMLALYLK